MAKLFRAVSRVDDKGKMEQIWEKYYGLMLYEAKKYFSTHASAEDAVSEACIKIFRNIDKIQEISSYQTRAYIVSIVRTTSIDALRKMSRTKEDADEVPEYICDSSPGILESIISKEGYESIKAAIEALPEQLRDVVYLSLVHNYSHGDIAKMLGISQAASKMRLLRAKKEIRKALSKNGNGGGDYDS